MHTTCIIRAFVALLSLSVTSCTGTKTPNIVLMVADDLGIGDVGCFGNDTIRTPNIDRIAAEGVKLTQHLAAEAVCTPSRAAFMTGRYPIRSGMAASICLRLLPFLSGSGGLPLSEVTIAEVAKSAGYETALIGKWHLGLNCEHSEDYCHHPLKQGFDYFFGWPHSNVRDQGDDGTSVFPDMSLQVYGIIAGGFVLGLALRHLGMIRGRGLFLVCFLASVPFLIWMYIRLDQVYLSSILMRNYDVVEQPIVLPGFTQRLVNEGQRYIMDRARDRRPFLLLMSWIQVHTALHASAPFKGRSAHGPYGDEVEEMDWSVGQILEALDKFGLADDTFVYFTSDHGGKHSETNPQGVVEGGWHGIYKGGKTQAGMEGGIRVPTVARWPSVIPAGSIIDVPTSMMDVLPTVAGMIQGEVPSDRTIDGRDISPLLRGDAGVRPPHEFLVHYCGDVIHAARYTPSDGQDVYKIFLATHNYLPGTDSCSFICCCRTDVTWHDPPLMYNIAVDPSEEHRLDTEEPKYKEVLNTMLDLLQVHKRGVVPAEAQLTISKVLFRPWLQKCCNFPYCSCRDELSFVPIEKTDV